MAESRSSPSAPPPAPRPAGAGAIIAFTTIAGAIGGGFLGQPALGMAAGLALGGGIAIAMWLLSRKG